MNLKRWIIATAILVVSVIAYGVLGGFNEVLITDQKDFKITLQGRLYEGSAKKGMGRMFDETNLLLKNQKSTEKLTAYFYNAATKENGYAVKVFIGATYSGGEKLSADYEVTTFELKHALRAQQTSHPLFTKAYRELFKTAETQKVTLDSAIVIEQYPTSDSLVIWVPVK